RNQCTVQMLAKRHMLRINPHRQPVAPPPPPPPRAAHPPANTAPPPPPTTASARTAAPTPRLTAPRFAPVRTVRIGNRRAPPAAPPDNVMGGTLVTRRGDIATVCHQRPAHDSSQPQPAERGGPSGTGPSQPIRPKARPDRRRPCAPPRTAPGHPPSSRCPRSP